jgi:salicylate hydroxylase
VVGGGIGGLAAALSLHRAGIDVHVFEQSRVLREVGAGIQVSPNASRVLSKLGLADELEAMGVRSVAWHQRRWDDGTTLLRTALGDAVVEAFGYPHYQMHRADLLEALIRALPAERVHLGHRLAALEDDGDRVEAQFENAPPVDVDVLVGADGIHSTVRSILFGPQEARFTGCVAYRGLVPAERLRSLDLEATSEVWMGPGRHFVRYFVQNKKLLNFVAVGDQDTWTGESWNDHGEVADALAEYEGWHPQVREIIAAVDETFVWALFDREPLERWSAGRVTLLGDACHPMLPFMAPGGGAGDRGRRDAYSLPRARRRRRRRAAPLRGLAPPACVEAPRSVVDEQDTLPSSRRARATGARRADGRRSDRFLSPGGRLDLRLRRRRHRVDAAGRSSFCRRRGSFARPRPPPGAAASVGHG